MVIFIDLHAIHLLGKGKFKHHRRDMGGGRRHWGVTCYTTDKNLPELLIFQQQDKT